jgi:hypothetical protein
MPRYVTIGYGSRAGYDRTPQPMRDGAHAQDRALAATGALIGMAGAPVQVRNPEGAGTVTLNAPFVTAALPVAGFAVIEADSIEAAIAKVAQSPCAICHGVVEVWPLVEPDGT